eukprot:g2468.t1
MGGGSVVVTRRWLLCASTALLWAVTYAGTFDSYLAGQSSTLTTIDIDDGTMSGTIPNTLHTDFPNLVGLKLQNTLISDLVTTGSGQISALTALDGLGDLTNVDGKKKTSAGAGEGGAGDKSALVGYKILVDAARA